MIQYRLRTLMLVVTLFCVFFGYVAYRLGYGGRHVDGFEFLLAKTDPQAAAQRLRNDLGSLPGHKVAEELLFALNIDPPRARAVGRGTLADDWYYRVKLSDGSETKVGVWVTDKSAVVVIYAWDRYPVAKRSAERAQLRETYQEVIAKMDLENQMRE